MTFTTPIADREQDFACSDMNSKECEQMQINDTCNHLFDLGMLHAILNKVANSLHKVDNSRYLFE